MAGLQARAVFREPSRNRRTSAAISALRVSLVGFASSNSREREREREGTGSRLNPSRCEEDLHVYKIVPGGDFNKNCNFNFTKLFMPGYKILNAILTEMNN